VSAACNFWHEWLLFARRMLRGCPGPAKPHRLTLTSVETVVRYLVNVALPPVADADVNVRHFHYSIDGADQTPLTLAKSATVAAFYVPAGAAAPFATPSVACFLHDVDYAGNESIPSDTFTFTCADNTPPAKPGTLGAGPVNLVPDEPPAP